MSMLAARAIVEAEVKPATNRSSSAALGAVQAPAATSRTFPSAVCARKSGVATTTSSMTAIIDGRSAAIALTSINAGGNQLAKPTSPKLLPEASPRDRMRHPLRDLRGLAAGRGTPARFGPRPPVWHDTPNR